MQSCSRRERSSTMQQPRRRFLTVPASPLIFLLLLALASSAELFAAGFLLDAAAPSRRTGRAGVPPLVVGFLKEATLTAASRRRSQIHLPRYRRRNSSSFSRGARPLEVQMTDREEEATSRKTETDSLLPTTTTDNADDAGRKQSEKKPSTGRAILELAVPAAGALLIDPLMTLADTAFVGRFSGGGPYPLAGMGSAAALLTFSFYLFNFLCTATTPLVATERAAGRERKAEAVGGQALSLSLGLGAALTAALFLFRQPLLRLMGTGVTGAAANGYALDFLSVRAFAAPAVLCIEASTGVLRGYLDTRTPIVILIAANLLNLLLDVVLIVFAGLGPMGAAIATTTSEWISAGLFLLVLAGKLPSAAGELGSNHEVSPGKRASIVPLMSIPEFSEVKPLLVASSSVFFRALVLQVSLSAAAATAARGGGAMATGAAASIAAHQIGIQLWLLCSFFCDSLAAASQGLVADALGRKNADDFREVSRTIFSYSLVLGISLASLLLIGASTGWIYDIFTRDSNTRKALSEILPLIVVAQPLNALVFAADGVIQGASEFPFQAKAMAVSGFTAIASFAVLEYGLSDADTLVHVWTALLVLQLARGLTSLWKLVDRDGPIDLLATTSEKVVP